MTQYKAYIEFVFDENDLPKYPNSDKLFSAQNVAYEQIMEIVNDDNLELFDLIKVETIN